MTSHSIVVGLDESASSRAALEWAAKHAKLTGSVGNNKPTVVQKSAG